VTEIDDVEATASLLGIRLYLILDDDGQPEFRDDEEADAEIAWVRRLHGIPDPEAADETEAGLLGSET
jgi:hypothetical protein